MKILNLLIAFIVSILIGEMIIKDIKMIKILITLILGFLSQVLPSIWRRQ